MENLFFAGIFFLSIYSFGDNQKSSQGIVEYKVTQATYSSVHVQNATRAQLILNFDKSEVELNIQVAFRCPEGRICAQVMPVPVSVELPIVSVKTDSCGVRVVEAQLDNRSADGELQNIEIVDPSHITCETLGLISPKATYTTSYTDHRNGQTVVNQSKMLLSLEFVRGSQKTKLEENESALSSAVLVKYVIGSGFSPNPREQTLSVDKSGRVINTIKNLRNAQVTTTQLAQFSLEGLKNLNDKIAAVPLDLKLVDENEGEPKCLDAPSSSIIVSTENREVVIAQRASCHNFVAQISSTYDLRDLMLGLVSLTY